MNEIKKAIELLKADKNIIIESSAKEDFAIDNLNEFDLAIEALEKQLNSGWIPVSERLPETGGYYLVSTKYEIPRVMIGFYYKDLNLWNYWMSTLEIKSVIAWQPLPETYKEVLD